MSNDPRPRTLIAGVLAGGRSRRMGRPKALLPLPGGRTLIEHVACVAAEVADEVLILGAGAPLPKSLASHTVLEDPVPGGGPLAGLCSLLDQVNDGWGLLLGCDQPWLDVGLIQAMLHQPRSTVDAVVFERTDRPGSYHACTALYHGRLLFTVRNQLAAGRKSLQDLLSASRLHVLRPLPQQERALRSANTPQDLTPPE